jgi:hypothetical protein
MENTANIMENTANIMENTPNIMENIYNLNTSYFYLKYIYSLLNPYRNTKPSKNKLNKIYKPSKLSICNNAQDICNFKKEQSKNIYFLIYYDENYDENI